MVDVNITRAVFKDKEGEKEHGELSKCFICLSV